MSLLLLLAGVGTGITPTTTPKQITIGAVNLIGYHKVDSVEIVGHNSVKETEIIDYNKIGDVEFVC